MVSETVACGVGRGSDYEHSLMLRKSLFSGLNTYNLEHNFIILKIVQFKSQSRPAKPLRRLIHPFSFIGLLAPEVHYLILLVRRALAPQIARIQDKYYFHRDQESKRKEFFSPEGACLHNFPLQDQET
ncbi:hypothetical protein TNCT_98531 [Trichonephila clavata]|uniref:Uncharacterized protein n=1 Tax=Trichonephila clavata TaxID=2740835 RepID=A0A8X6H6R3_TRICU|nr:hypothetical protein TNCT_98531 [Trichonephila clavata]